MIAVAERRVLKKAISAATAVAVQAAGPTLRVWCGCVPGSPSLVVHNRTRMKMTCSIYNVAVLHPLSRVVCVSQLGFLGGRLAIRRALNGMKGAAAASASLAILHNQDGAPLLPEGISASISHKRHMAVALVQSGCEGHLGTSTLIPSA